MPSPGKSRVSDGRGALIKQYVAGTKNIEQQFVISRPLVLGTEDLLIRGAVSSPGRFELVAGSATETAWQWRSGAHLVRLGDVKVNDAKGVQLPSMQVSATRTSIPVDTQALAAAAYPVTTDPEIGTNDFRISDMGPDGDEDFDADEPAVAYNGMDNEYLVVWHGDDDTGSLVDEEHEIFGRLEVASGSANWSRAYVQLGLNTEQLSSMRTYCDEVLEDDARGRIFVALLYARSKAALDRLERDPALMQEARSLVDLHYDAIVQVLAGGEGTIRDSDRVLVFLEDFGRDAAPTLRLLTKSLIRGMRTHKDSAEPFFGFFLE